MLGVALGVAGKTMGRQDADMEDRPISEIRIQGLSRVSEQLIRNNIRSSVGDPFHEKTVQGDVRTLTRLGEFRIVDAAAEFAEDGTIVLTFQLEEQVIIKEVRVVGNALVAEKEILGAARIRRGLPRDDYQIERGERAIEQIYRQRGHYLTNVTIDEGTLESEGVLIYRVIEGPRVRVKAVVFEGAYSFRAKRLMAEIKTRPALFLLRRGELDEETLASDVAAIHEFYRARGFLDVRVDRTIRLSPNSAEAKVSFLVEEGERYTLRSVQTTNADGGALRVFATEQIAAMIDLRTGDVYSEDLLRRSLTIVEEAYQIMGYADVLVRPIVEHVSERPEVDLRLVIDEKGRSFVGPIIIQGNFLTRDKVIRREMRVKTGRYLDSTRIKESQRRLEHTRLFNEVRIVPQQPDPDDPRYRDILVEVKERNTGSFNFGAAIGSDSGVFGDFSLVQNNFDIADVPESLREFAGGRAFRGAGQQFAITLRPGSEFFQYSVSLTEPHIFDSDYAFSISGNFRDRQFDRYDEERLSLSLGLSRQLGDVWNVGVRTRFETVELTTIDDFAPTEIFQDAGPDTLISAGFTLTRSTIETITRPGEGSRLSFNFDHQGLLGGDFDFNKATLDYAVFFTLNEDFLGRKSILRLNSKLGYIWGGRPPTYEQFYLGGRSFRGFDFREVSPKGIRADTLLPSDDPVGGQWMVFAGAQYEFPLVQDAFNGVFFAETGTVTDTVGFDEFRATVGMGIRLHVPQLGPVPIAFDFAFPIQSQATDDKQVFSFTAELPF